MKKLLVLSLLLGANAIAITYLDLPGGGRPTTIKAGDEVVVRCMTTAVDCQITYIQNTYVVKQGENAISNFYRDATDAAKIFKQYRADGICP